MAYLGSAAYRLDSVETSPRLDDRRDFEVIQGGGLDARARQGLSRDFLARLRVFVICVVSVVALGSARVALSVAAVSSMKGNEAIQASIDQALDDNTNLRVLDAQLSAASRIDAIATQNLGMVPTAGALSTTATTSLKSTASADAASASPAGARAGRTSSGKASGSTASSSDSSAVNAQSSTER